MRGRARFLLALLLLPVVLAGCSDDDDADADAGADSASVAEETSSSTSTTAASSTSTAEPTTTTPPANGPIVLTGAAVVPGPGDPDGTGRAVVRLVPERNEVCYELSVSRIDPATGAQLRRGRAGQAAESVLTLRSPADGPVTTCAAADAILIADLQAAPADFAVVVTNETYPNGALRGQLR